MKDKSKVIFCHPEDFTYQCFLSKSAPNWCFFFVNMETLGLKKECLRNKHAVQKFRYMQMYNCWAISMFTMFTCLTYGIFCIDKFIKTNLYVLRKNYSLKINFFEYFAINWNQYQKLYTIQCIQIYCTNFPWKWLKQVIYIYLLFYFQMNIKYENTQKSTHCNVRIKVLK